MSRSLKLIKLLEKDILDSPVTYFVFFGDGSKSLSSSINLLLFFTDLALTDLACTNLSNSSSLSVSGATTFGLAAARLGLVDIFRYCEYY